MAQPTATSYSGDFIAWPGVCGFIGSRGGKAPIHPHAHYAIQLVIGAPSGLRVQFGAHGDWQPCAAALVPSRATHSIDVSECDFSLVLFIEPETATGKALAARLDGRPELLDAGVVSAANQRLLHAWRVEQSDEAVRAVCSQLLAEVSATAPRQPSDARVLAAMEAVCARIDEPPSLAELAQAANLSPGRFRHLFVQHTGMPLRTYIVWRRLLHVWTLLTRGESLAAAAHMAGFADSAHLSRTARTMFGLPPSVLQVNGPLSMRARQQPQRAATTGPVSAPRKAATSRTSAGDS